MFAPENDRDVAHKRHRITAVQNVLRGAHNSELNPTTDWTETTQTLSVLEDLSPLLAQSGISSDEILTSEQNVQMLYLKNAMLKITRPLVTACESITRGVGNTQLCTAFLKFFGQCSAAWTSVTPRNSVVQAILKFLVVKLLWAVGSFMIGLVFRSSRLHVERISNLNCSSAQDVSTDTPIVHSYISTTTAVIRTWMKTELTVLYGDVFGWVDIDILFTVILALWFYFVWSLTFQLTTVETRFKILMDQSKLMDTVACVYLGLRSLYMVLIDFNFIGIVAISATFVAYVCCFTRIQLKAVANGGKMIE